MNILGDRDNVTVSMQGMKTTNPYKMMQNDFYAVSIQHNKKTMYRVLFSNLYRARKLSNTRKKEIELIEVPLISTDTGNSVEKIFFYNEVCYRKYENEIHVTNQKNLGGENDFTFDGDIDTIRHITDPSGFYDEDDEDYDSSEITNEDKAAKEREFEALYTKSLLSAERKAKNLLGSLSKFYLSSKMISENDYLKAKIEIEQQSLSGLIMQMDISKESIKKIMRDIYVNKASFKQYESLSKLQKIVIDINAAISALIKEGVKDMREIERRAKEIEEQKIEEQKGEDINGRVLVQSNSLTETLKFLKGEMGMKAGDEGDSSQ
jgi:hypothetical protein